MTKVLSDRVVLKYEKNIALCLFQNNQFVTWYSMDCKSFAYGRYFGDDLDAALEDFHKRVENEAN